MKTGTGKAQPAVLGIILALLPQTGSAHSFAPIYTLPLPFWMYGWGAATTLLVSFIAVAWFMHRPAAHTPNPGRRLIKLPDADGRFIVVARALALAALTLCIVAGLIGSNRPYANINMTLFWVIFLVGFPYLTALFGDSFHTINPWQTLARLGQRTPLVRRRRLTLPAGLSGWPAVGLLLGFLWLELFGKLGPFELSLWLLGYTLLMLVGSLVFGVSSWLENAEIFGRMLHLLGSQSITHVHQRTLSLRWPCVGAEDLRFASFGSVVFILTWLAGTAFDGLHQSLLFQRWFFTDMYQAGLYRWAGENMRAAYPRMLDAFFWWQSLCLVLLPLLYAAIYLACMALTRQLARGGPGTLTLARAFAPSLVPIALVYHAAHYYTLLQTQGVKIIALASDPFGWNWNLFGTADWLQRTIIPDTAIVWRVQLALIVGGHIAGVVLAHRQALQLYPTARKATLSQLPFLVLMAGFTVFGLWILSLPAIDNR